LKPLLLDTHALLWGVGDDQRLSPTVHELLESGAVATYVSAASIWEISIKQAAGKLEAPENLLEAIARANFIELGISFAHARMAGRLPPHHRDPFNRMIVAQARSEDFTVVTRDARIAAYDVPVLW
jgi:PIN domain nuclease of toxin-antitoxin system